jgi:PKHD-type hydroxylase
VLICIPAVLTKEEVAHCRARLAAVEWADGVVTAGQQSRMAKRNRQVPEGSPVARELGDLILGALARSTLFVSAALPLKTFPPLFNAYAGGESFGTHIDNAIRVVRCTPVRVRTDLAATLFLSEPETYGGGELVIELAFGAQEVKLAAGDLVLYPASSLHRVNAVTAGERLGSFFWVQSMVRDKAARALLFDLDQSVQALGANLGLDHPEVLRLSGLYHNLVRRWAET